MHACSVLCATGIGGCCGNEDNDHDKKSCCANDKKSEDKDHDCQVLHLSYFSTTGQFCSDKVADAIKAFQPITALVVPLFITKPVEAIQITFAYNSFHPPPPNADIRILIRSFQI